MLWFNFILGLNYSFFCFFGLVMYDNELKTKNNKTKDKSGPQHILCKLCFQLGHPSGNTLGPIQSQIGQKFDRCNHV